jgi:hypothetical protein
MPSSVEFIQSPFAFVSHDVTRQIEISRQMAAELEGMDRAFGDLEKAGADAALLSKLRNHRNTLMQLAKSLAQNASHTSSTATSVFTSVATTTSG